MKAQFNGQEGRVRNKEAGRIEVELAQTSKHEKPRTLRVHSKHLTLMPTYSISRCKLAEHRVYHCEPCYLEPVSMMPDVLTGTHYDILRVERTATTEEIKTAFRKMSVTVHPDKNPANTVRATRLFKQVMTAYECLKDNARRMAYDQDMFRAPQAWPRSGPRPGAPDRWTWW